MEGIFAGIFSIRPSFSDFSRDVAMATNFVAKLPNPLHLYRSGIYTNGMGYRYLKVRINSVKNMV